MENRNKALDLLKTLLPPDKYTSEDAIIEELIRKIRGFSPRPAGREIYEGLFPTVTQSELVTEELLLSIGLNSEGASKWAPPLNEAANKYGITTPLRIAHFLAQLLHESGMFKFLVENLNYSAEGLISTWPTRFNKSNAPLYARQPEKIANFVYSDRMGNGSVESGDGWRYRGRGIIQLTGRSNYKTYGDVIGVDIVNNPDKATEPYTASALAAAFWSNKNINAEADKDDIIAVTRKINGGLNGIEDRKKYLALLKRSLNLS